jgi:hypothetical protein
MPTLEQLIAEALELTEGQEKRFRDGSQEVKVQFDQGATQNVGMVWVWAYAYDKGEVAFSAWYLVTIGKDQPDADLVMIEGMLKAALVAVS